MGSGAIFWGEEDWQKFHSTSSSSRMNTLVLSFILQYITAEYNMVHSNTVENSIV